MSSAISNTTLHVVLDDNDINRARHFADFCDRAFGFSRAHAAGRLVEQQQPRLGNQRHPDLEQRDIAIGQRSGRTPGQRGQPDLLERLLDPFARLPIARGSAEWVQKPLRRLPRDPEIFGDAELRKYALDLQAFV